VVRRVGISLTLRFSGSPSRVVRNRSMSEVLTRRTLIARSAAAGAVLVLPARALSASKTLPVFRLETGCGDGWSACGPRKAHDKSSLFPTQKAADGNRAHPGCNCVIREGTLDRGTHIAVFGNPDHLRSYRADLRVPVVQALLKNHPASFPG